MKELDHKYRQETNRILRKIKIKPVTKRLALVISLCGFEAILCTQNASLFKRF
jgi:hypothetical protein